MVAGQEDSRLTLRLCYIGIEGQTTGDDGIVLFKKNAKHLGEKGPPDDSALATGRVDKRVLVPGSLLAQDIDCTDGYPSIHKMAAERANRDDLPSRPVQVKLVLLGTFWPRPV
jgi:hypothetical protein